MIGLLAAVAVHLLAGLALLPVVRLNVPADRAHPLRAAAAPVVIVQLIRWRPAAAPQTLGAPMPASAPKPKAPPPPEEPAPFAIAQSEPETPSPVPPSRPEDDDPLYRVPFRDAVAQADARLRAGLSCEHVDLAQLPKAVLDQCAAAAKFKGAA
jgi:hypothetical protein